jgi:hypothetical protein
LNKIYSKSEPGRLLHVILDTNEPFENRLDLCDGKEWLQISVIKLPAAKKVNPHIHHDQTPLHQQILPQGNMLVTFYGGHALECETPGAVMIECKNGPYLGRDYTTFEPASAK